MDNITNDSLSKYLRLLSAKIKVYKLDDNVLQEICQKAVDIDSLIRKNNKTKIFDKPVHLQINNVQERRVAMEQGFFIDEDYKPDCYMSDNCHNVSCFCYPDCVITNKNSWFNKKK